MRNVENVQVDEIIIPILEPGGAGLVLSHILLPLEGHQDLKSILLITTRTHCETIPQERRASGT